MPAASEPFCLMLSITDVHFGLRTWAAESGSDFNMERCRERLVATTEDLLSRLPGRPEFIIVPIGSDFFHCDGLKPTTTKGTVLEVDGTPREVFVKGLECIITELEVLRQIAPLELWLADGNHDMFSSLAAQMYLKAYYRTAEDVDVQDDHASRHYELYGSTLIGLTHGDGPKAEKLPGIMAVEAAEAWGQSKRRVFFFGHMHHEKVLQDNGVTLIQMPSMAPKDRWHSYNGFVGAEPQLQGYCISPEKGLTTVVYAYP